MFYFLQISFLVILSISEVIADFETDQTFQDQTLQKESRSSEENVSLEVRGIKDRPLGVKSSILRDWDDKAILIDYDDDSRSSATQFFLKGRYGLVHMEEERILIILDRSREGAIAAYYVRTDGRLAQINYDMVREKYSSVVSKTDWQRGLTMSDFHHNNDDGGFLRGSVVVDDSGKRILVSASSSYTQVSRLYCFEAGEAKILYYKSNRDAGKFIVFNRSQKAIAAFQRQKRGVLQRIPMSETTVLGGLWDRDW